MARRWEQWTDIVFLEYLIFLTSSTLLLTILCYSR